MVLLKDEKGAEIKKELDQAPSQKEDSRLLEFENRLKHNIFALFQSVLDSDPDLEKAIPIVSKRKRSIFLLLKREAGRN